MARKKTVIHCSGFVQNKDDVPPQIEYQFINGNVRIDIAILLITDAASN